MNKLNCWYVFSMDEGILRVESKLGDAVHWCLEQSTGEVIRRTRKPDGWYQVQIGSSPRDCRVWTIARGDVLTASGGNIEQRPLYPLRNQPHERVER